jgi:hypothetical protein
VHGVRRVTLLTLPVLALALTACGGNGPRPGTAVAIDGGSITTRHVDQVASRYCAALSTTSNGNAVPVQAIRSQVVSALTARLAAKRFADERGIEPDASYAQAVARLRPQIAGFDAGTRAAITEVETAQSYVDAVLKRSSADALSGWLRKQSVEVNPVYGLRVDGDRITRADPSLSVAASDLARSALAAAEDPTATDAATLPASQRCGG